MRQLRRLMSQQVPRIFNAQVKEIQQRRSVQEVEMSRKTDYVKNWIAESIADRMYDIKGRKFENVLDLGSGPGFVESLFDPEIVGKVTMYHNCKEQLFRDQDKVYPVKAERVVGSLDKLEFEENSFDAIISCGSLHWVNDLLGTLIQANRCLKPDGLFLGAMIGGDSLYELRTALQLAELEREGGVSPHISPMVRHQEMGSLLSRSKFNLTTVDVDELTVNYPSMFELMYDLKQMGEQNAVLSRKPYTSPDTFLAANAIYQELYGNEYGIPATFQIIYMIGWKPHSSQQKPAERGSGKQSLVDILKN